MGGFPKLGGVPIIRMIRVFKVLYWVPPSRETTMLEAVDAKPCKLSI